MDRQSGYRERSEKGGATGAQGWKGKLKGKGKSKGDWRKGQVAPLNLPTAKWPELCAAASYCYALKDPHFEVLSPACHCRWFKHDPCALKLTNLRFEALKEMQRLSGGFEVTVGLLASLGATEPGAVLRWAKSLEPHQGELLGALLVLKSAELHLGARSSAEAEEMCRRCEALTAKSSEVLELMGRQKLEEILGQTFGVIKGLWSFFELWERLLPSKVLCPLSDTGAIFCTRFFLVDLATAAWSPYEIDECYPLFIKSNQVYMGQLPRGFARETTDGMRQGHQLEAAWVLNSHLEEEKILMSFQLPCGQHVIYAAAPDAIDPRKCTERIGSEPLEREEDFLKAGYEAGPPFSYPTDAKKQCRIWRSQRASAVDVPLDAYVEIKKTTHLNGLNGSYKLLKYWLQAALVKAGAVCVAFADDTGDVSHTETFTMHRIEKELQERFQDRDLLSKEREPKC
ncbi:Acetylornithine aminotransferase [Durusdinium trenchii]|uniref:Mitochondrial n=1 Tax=Durusdinium trenchii TaxID=1381693 RepID=A0ABP0IRI9_9DINO